MKIWAFDLGVSSIGYAIRTQTDELKPFDAVESLLIPEKVGSLETARQRRRAHRTRLAHKARENWLRRVFREAGLSKAILEGRSVGKRDNKWQLVRKGDYRLERAFPPHPGARTNDGAPSDERGANTVYCGALLRALLIAGPAAQQATQGRTLEPWQIFKALHSAIQKRGYDPNLPWKRGCTTSDSASRKNGDAPDSDKEARTEGPRGKARNDSDPEEGETRAAAEAMQGLLERLPRHRQYPCFWECQQMGLWECGESERFHIRQTHRAATTTQQRIENPAGGITEEPAVFLRRAVEMELLDLCAAAEHLAPELAGKARYIAYGPTETAYASYQAAHANPAERKEMFDKAGGPLVPGKATDWQGALSQKIPTFDNRAPGACLLIPRYHAAKSSPRTCEGKPVEDSLLPAEYVFLKQLKDLRFATKTGDRGFTASELRAIFAERHKKIVEQIFQNNGELAECAKQSLRLTRTELGKWVRKFGGTSLLPEQDKIEPPQTSGRSSYSRPALRILIAVILSGLSPRECRRRLLQREGDDFRTLAGELHLGNDAQRGLVAEDLAFLERMGDNWDSLFVPDARLAEAAKAAVNADATHREALVRELIGSVPDPIVRHRLETLYRLIKRLEAQHGPPDRVAIEFVRDQFMRGNSKRAEKRRSDWTSFQNRRRKERAQALAILQGQGSAKDILKVQLWKEQDGNCPFCGHAIGRPGVSSADQTRSFNRSVLAHIVPESAGGPRTYLNLVAACHTCNDQQKDRYHALWFQQDGLPWDAFRDRVASFTKMSRFKRKLLSCEDSERAADMVERRTALQQTAWISKLSQAVMCLHFGWPLNFAGTDRKIIVVPGALTNQTARRSGLYELLGTEELRQEREKELAQLKAAAEQNHDSPEDRTKAWVAYFNEVEAAHEKLRTDKRHHALDAMVLSFIPTWATDPTKKYWRGLPKEANLPYFKQHLARVLPRTIATERAGLEESNYRDRKGQAVRRYFLKELAYKKGLNKTFDIKTARKSAQKIVDANIRRLVTDFLQSDCSESAWNDFCRSARVVPGGPLVRRITQKVSDDLSEFRAMAKDGRGAWRRGDKHQGYFVIVGADGSHRVRPVYAHERRADVEREITSKCATVYGFFSSGCLINIEKALTQGKNHLAAGPYILRSLRKDGYAYLESPDGKRDSGIALTRLIAAGMKRID
ncbi:MAG: HNH endonuclease [Verrucomicrobia bacterium]|nr:HNH endonuclease [Kiritimatiellia bacterium]MCO6399704.1 HNH endonuclease [Verrucomicrobiota bacterium]